jgi:hypothetical protein
VNSTTAKYPSLLFTVFDNLTVTDLPSAGIAGDYNGNGTVDAADYVLWKNGGPLQNDATPGVDASDYAVWKAAFGNHAGSGSGFVGASVPEPASLILLATSVAFAGMRRAKGMRVPSV